MSLVVMDGFEVLPNLRNSVQNNATILAITGRDGVGKAFASSTNTNAYATMAVPSAATFIMGIGCKVTQTVIGSTSVSNTITLYGDSGATAHLSLNFDASGHLVLRRGPETFAIIATSTQTLPSLPAGNTSAVGYWFYLEVKATIADAGGTCIARINGVEWINFTGDTRNAGTATTVSMIRFPASAAWASDDLWVLDGVDGTTLAPPQKAAFNDFIGEKVIRASRPSGNGASSQWLGSDGNSVDNYLLMREDPWNQTDYVTNSTATQRDTYDYANVIGLSTVDAVQVVGYASKSDAGVRGIKFVTRSSIGATAIGPDNPLSTTWTVYQDVIRTQDENNTPWTLTKVNAHEYGIELT
jgi:hypothetical protein